MNRKDDIDRLDDMLAKHLHHESASFDFEQWARRFPEDAKLVQTGFVRPVSNRRNQLMRIGRIIMASRYTKLAGVAAVVLVTLSFLFPHRNGILPASIAWADVQKAVDQMHSARVTGTRDCFFSPSETPTYRLRVEKLFSLSDGYVDRTFAEDGHLIIEGAYHLPTGTVTVLLPNFKRYYRAEVPREFHENMKQVTPERFFEWLFASGEYRQVGPKEVQGIQAVGFEVADLPERFTGGLGFSGKLLDFFFSIGPSSTCLWVDPETRLPIQAQAEGEIKPCLLTGFQEMKLREIDDGWEFNVELDAGQFLPTIPEDYQALALPGTS